MPPVPCDDVPCAPNWLGRNIYVRRMPPVWGSEMPSEIHVFNLFSRCGSIERLRVLRDRFTHQPLGSALVLFVEARSAALALQYIHSGAVPGAIADFWLPRTLLRGSEVGEAAGADGWARAAIPAGVKQLGKEQGAGEGASDAGGGGDGSEAGGGEGASEAGVSAPAPPSSPTPEESWRL